jgi:hypothetical protein
MFIALQSLYCIALHCIVDVLVGPRQLWEGWFRGSKNESGVRILMVDGTDFNPLTSYDVHVSVLLYCTVLYLERVLESSCFIHIVFQVPDAPGHQFFRGTHDSVSLSYRALLAPLSLLPFYNSPPFSYFSLELTVATE